MAIQLRTIEEMLALLRKASGALEAELTGAEMELCNAVASSAEVVGGGTKAEATALVEQHRSRNMELRKTTSGAARLRKEVVRMSMELARRADNPDTTPCRSPCSGGSGAHMKAKPLICKHDETFVMLVGS